MESNPLYQKYQAESDQFDDRLAKRAADKLIRDIVTKNPLADVKEQEGTIKMALDFIEFDAFKEMATELGDADIKDVPRIIDSFAIGKSLRRKK